jgi:hypothetical protein
MFTNILSASLCRRSANRECRHADSTRWQDNRIIGSNLLRSLGT